MIVSQQSKLKFSDVRKEHWEKEQYLPSILPSLAASQYAWVYLT